jgi:hypothetical protein
MPVTLKSSGGGSVTMDVPSTASTFTLTLPAVTGTVLQTGTAVTVAQGGTGLATLTANNVLLGNGTGTPNFVAPGTNGNVLTSNGTTWTSATPAATAMQYRSQIFSATGSTTWTAPTGVTQVKVLVVAAGGGNFYINGCCYSIGWGGGVAFGFVTVTPGTGYTVTVGTGGTAVASGTSNAGGSSSFGALISATGGSGVNLAGAGSNGTGSGGTLRNWYVGYSTSPYNDGILIPPLGASGSSSNTPLTWTASNNARPGSGGTTGGLRAGVNGLVYIEWVGA